MIGRLLRFALRQRFITLLLAGGLIFLGIWSFRRLKIEAYPDISDTGVVVITLFPGHAAEEVEQQVAIPIERALNNVPNVISRRSRIIFGLAVVELTFADGTDDYFARQLVLEKLRDAELPEGVTPTLGPLSSGISEFYRYKLEGEGYDAMGLREVQDWVVVPRLLQVAGVADVVSFGGLVKQYQIEIDPYKLEKYKLSVAQIAEAVNANNRNAGGSLLDNRQQALVVRGVGLIQSVDDLGNVLVHILRRRTNFRPRRRSRDDWRCAPDRFFWGQRDLWWSRRNRVDAPVGEPERGPVAHQRSGRRAQPHAASQRRADRSHS